MRDRKMGKVGTLAGCALIILSSATWVHAAPQAGGESQGTAATVTGHVTCADTQHAARFAQVELISAAASDGEAGYRGRGGFGGARTDLEGNFSIPSVSPGDYFLVGQLTGYVNQRGAVEAALSAGTDPATTVSGLTKVHVGAGGASGDLLLQRGGVVAGVVSWDDGSPAAGVQVALQPAPVAAAGDATAGQPNTSSPTNGFGGLGGTQTDDRGRFRLTGIATGSYVVRASVQAPMPQQGGSRFSRTLNLAVYAPDKPRKTDAVVIKVGAGEERDDIAVTMGLNALHIVAGVVSSPGAAVHSGTVSVTDQTDSTLNRTGVINSDGSFVVPYVPAGSYTLRVNASSQLQAQGGFGRGGPSQSGSGSSFQPLQESITISDADLTGVNLSVTSATGSSSQ